MKKQRNKEAEKQKGTEENFIKKILGGEEKMFWKRAEKKAVFYDKTGKTAVIRASICTGEKVAGFKDEATGKFEDMIVIRSDADLREFMSRYGVQENEIKKEW